MYIYIYIYHHDQSTVVSLIITCHFRRFLASTEAATDRLILLGLPRSQRHDLLHAPDFLEGGHPGGLEVERQGTSLPSCYQATTFLPHNCRGPTNCGVSGLKMEFEAVYTCFYQLRHYNS